MKKPRYHHIQPDHMPLKMKKPSGHKRGLPSIRAAIFLAALVLAPALFSCTTGPIKEPNVAGTFYPADKAKLSASVQGLLTNAKTVPQDGQLLAIVSPHAAFRYSGHVAAYGFEYLKQRNIKTVVIIGSSHYSSYTGASVYTSGSFRTPLGLVSINAKLAQSLIDEQAGVSFIPEVFDREHSLEVQLPFLQTVLKGKRFNIVPILIGNMTRDSYLHLSSKLADMLANEKGVFIVVSTDLSHYHPYDKAVEMDARSTNTVERLSINKAEALFKSGKGEMCGANAVLVTIQAARLVGATHGVLYKYANSGDVSNVKDKVVGYASMGIYKAPLTAEEKKELIQMARDTIVQYVETDKKPDIKTTNPKFLTDQAVFITIKREGQLRGCIGDLRASVPLYESIKQNAARASKHDSRFVPMDGSEIDDMDVEISILSAMKKVTDVEEIVVGTHGLYIMQNGRSGVLLPQVPVEEGWDKDRYLREVSMKAGLPPDAWENGATLFSFTADVFK